MDKVLIRRVQQLDDNQAFERLVTMYQLPVRKFLLRICHNNRDAADDIAQETFIAAYKNIKSYRGDGQFLSWLFGIAHQRFLTHLRKNKRQHQPLEEAHQTVTVGPQDTTDKQRFLAQMLASLSQQESMAVSLYYQQQLSQQEVAEVMDIPLGTVKTLIRRGRLKLQQLMAGES